MRKRAIHLAVLIGCMLLLSSCGRPKGSDTPAPLTPLPTTAQKSATPTKDPQSLLITGEPTPMENDVTPFQTLTEPKTYPVTEDTVKPLGRTYLYDDAMWLSYSGSGAEFFFAGKECKITLVSDERQAGDGHEARVAIYVDGERVQDVLMTEDEVTVTAVAGEEDTVATVRIVKLSEVSDSVAGIRSITAIGMITPLSKAGTYIEFIGDSITCGYGVDGELNKDTYRTSNEDCTKAYAYKTAEMLGADYSLVSLSGYGIISGYTDSGEKLPDKTIPKYYGTFGKSYGRFAGTLAPENVKWDFSGRKPDIIVINLGTNDASYCGADPERRREYIDGYKEFLVTVRKENPDAKIVCTLGIMGTDLCESMETAAAEYQAASGDKNITTMRFEQQSEADGLAVDWHPSEKTHEKAAKKLAAFLGDLLKADE